MPSPERLPIAPPDLEKLRVIFVRARDESGLTYDQLEQVTGLSRRTLVNLATGRYRGDLKTWLLLSRAFKTDLETLLAPVWERDD